MAIKLREAIVNAAGQLIERRSEVISKILSPKVLLNLMLPMGGLHAPTDDLSPEKAKTWNVDSIDKMVGEILKGNAPAWVSAPIMLLITLVAVSRGLMDASGITSEKAILQNLRKAIRPSLLGAGDLFEAERRGVSEANNTNESLARQGFTDDAIEILRKLNINVPGVQDVVHFAVRDVYDPSIVSQFKLKDNMGPFLKNAEQDLKRAGISNDAAEKYWMAHWVLPSVQQGFEMLHRGFIDETALISLMRAADINTFWAENLIKTAFTPFTRVDVRRMHKLGLLSDTEIVRAYKDIGYDDDKAAKLRDFTIAYNADPEEAEKTDKDKKTIAERDLTKSDVLRAFRDGTITKDKASAFLSTLGYSSVEADLLLAREIHRIESSLIDSYVSTYKNLYVRGVLDKEEIRKQLKDIPLTVEHIKQLFTLWDLERLAKLDLPSKAEILRFLKKELVDEDWARKWLARINIDEEFIDLFIKDALK